MPVEMVWNFIRTFIRPFGIQHGGDQQGGAHEGNPNRVVTHGATDYVSSYAIEGKLHHVNNLWRDFDVHQNDDLVLALRLLEGPGPDIPFQLSSSSRASRNERVSVSHPFYYLHPETLEFRSFSDVSYIHIGRSQKESSQYNRGSNICCWDARACVIPGAPLLLTFEPAWVESDSLFYKADLEDNEDVAPLPPPPPPKPSASEDLPPAKRTKLAAKPRPSIIPGP
jgi:hypothetical protein